ncbi:hypothetical protein [Streptomyces shenzhenensis]|uniref:Phage tail protein n=1 Tax=Streptomyces shenzhenensis TaxID=943815 RepID=A0A3M0I9S4_9ACTN|nr:hypothetical protein [Streptomyces shenzhenensis]RMB85625.1 hypothetical protein CTZ28_12620 [Streptomyces shenzhenensis]
MADDINLPNLVSHLAVNLDGVSGAITDASRQGSAMGSALGHGIHRELDSLLSHLPQVVIDGDSDPLDRDLARIHRELAQLDAQRIGVDISVPDALRELDRLETHLQRIGDEHPNVNVGATTRQAAAQLNAILAAARHVDDTDVDIDVHVDEDHVNRLRGVLGRLAGMAGSIGGVAAPFGKVAAAIGTVIPVAAGATATIADILPASGVAVTGLMSIVLAGGAVKLAMAGVGDAIGAALDPEKADDFAKALEKLSPEARAFALAVHDAAPALRQLQQDVQNKFFRGLANELERTGRSVLPVLRTNLLSTATALHDMAAGVLGAARELADSGTLGKALGSASKGLRNLSGVPGVVVTALGQIGAAAGPSFERLTAAAGRSTDRIGERLTDAFESGRMQDAIKHAIDLLGDLFDVAGNVVEIIGNIFSAVPSGGGGMLSVLQSVTAELAKITAGDDVQAALRALFETMAVIGRVAAPLLGLALQALAPAITVLGPPVQRLVGALGDALRPVIKGLRPVLESAAGAFGGLLDAVGPLLPVLGTLVAALLPVLIPLFDALQRIFAAAAPSVRILADILSQTLAPIFDALPALITPLLDAFAEMAEQQGPLLAQLLVQLQPSLVQLGVAFGQVLEQVGPLLPQLLMLGATLFQQIAPYLPPLIAAFTQLAAVFTEQLVWVLEHLVVPALRLVNSLLTGDTPKAAATAGKAMSGLQQVISTVWAGIVSYVQQKVAEVVVWIAGLPGRAGTALGGLAGSLSTQANRAGTQLVAAVRAKLDEAVGWIRGLPGRAASVLGGGLGGVLFGAGASLISGFIAGIVSKIPSVQSVLNGITSRLPDWKGPKQKDAKILTPAGRALIEGFIKGIDGTTSQLKSKLAQITKALPDNVKSGYGKALAKATAELEKQIAKRDAVLKKLTAAQKKLDDLVKARNKAASDIRSGILDEANITTGHADVNSVAAITVGLQQSLKAAKEFQANIAKLEKAGLRSDLLQQIGDAGVEAGGATAAALANATPEELKKINDLQAQLAKSATATGNTVGDALYGAGIRAAQGLVDGLKSQEKAIEKQMKKIAEGMLSTVKKAHQTHSPSRKFRWLGEMDGEGLREGLLASTKRVREAARSMAGAALDVASGVGQVLVGTPSAGQLAAVYGGTGGDGGQHNTFHLYGSEASPDGILRALSWRGMVGRR